jgi:tetratricopeptide (TPR) repeat protein
LERAAQDEDFMPYLPDTPIKRSGLAFFNLATFYYAVGDMAKARGYFIHAAKLYPELMVDLEIWLYLLKSALGPRFMRSSRYLWQVIKNLFRSN